jgi:hypothetical protein
MQWSYCHSLSLKYIIALFVSRTTCIAMLAHTLVMVGRGMYLHILVLVYWPITPPSIRLPLDVAYGDP